LQLKIFLLFVHKVGTGEKLGNYIIRLRLGHQIYSKQDYLWFCTLFTKLLHLHTL